MTSTAQCQLFNVNEGNHDKDSVYDDVFVPTLKLVGDESKIIPRVRLTTLRVELEKTYINKNLDTWA